VYFCPDMVLSVRHGRRTNSHAQENRNNAHK
jgi:hypothetical protein